MNSFSEQSASLIDKIGDYAHTSADLIKLKIIQKVADVISALVSRVLIFLLFILFSLFVNIGIALYIGKLFDQAYLGFLIMSLFYLLLAVVLYRYSDALIGKPVSNRIVEQMLDQVDIEDLVKGNDEEHEK